MSAETDFEAVANADAHLNNVDLPTYSEAMAALDSAAASLLQLVKLNRIPANMKGLRDALNVLNRVKNRVPNSADFQVPAETVVDDGGVFERCQAILATGKPDARVEAVRLYRMTTGKGLPEAMRDLGLN